MSGSLPESAIYSNTFKKSLRSSFESHRLIAVEGKVHHVQRILETHDPKTDGAVTQISVVGRDLPLP